ncbi:MAG TPA: Uma2 family endonuclease [Chloroflexota bacterium]
MVTTLAPTRRYSIDDLDDFPDDGKLRELVDGQIVEWDVTSRRHGLLEAELTRVMGTFVREHHLGSIGNGEVMVRILGSRHDARGSDIEFTRRGRLTGDDLDAPAALTVPDLVVEVLSANDRADRVLDKVHDWMRTGVRILWYVDPETGLTTVYEGDHVRQVVADDVLDGGDVLPGLQLRMQDLLRAITADQE